MPLALLFTSLLFWSASLDLGTAQAQQVAVIVHKDVPVESIDPSALQRIYLMEYSRWNNGSRVKLFDLRGNDDSKTIFFEGIERKPRDLKRTWMRLILSGEAPSPTTVSDVNAMLNGVASTPGAIGYVPVHLVDDRVKVVAHFPMP